MSKPMTDSRLGQIRESVASQRRFMAAHARSIHINDRHFVTHIEELLAEVDRLRADASRPPGVARVRLTASWLEPKVGSLFRRGEAESDGLAMDMVWLDEDFARGRGAELIIRGMYEIIEGGDDAEA